MAAQQNPTAYVPKFEIGQTNFSSMATIGDAGDDFKFLVEFINNSYLKKAFNGGSALVRQRLDDLWESAEFVLEDDNEKIMFSTKGRTFKITYSTINKALGIVLADKENFSRSANEVELERFFWKIGYAGPVLQEGSTEWYPTGEMDRKYLRKEWNMLFDAVTKVFSAKTTGWNVLGQRSVCTPQ